MRRVIVAIALAAVLVSSVAVAAPKNPKAGKVACATQTAQKFRPFSAKVWKLSLWERGKPAKKAVRAQRNRLKCARSRRHLKAMRRTWRSDKRAFYSHRASMRELIALTPYECGSAGRFAIPCYVVACESGYDWGAVNPSSGAFSAYQFLPSTYYGACRSCDQSKTDLHYVAGVVWSRSGGSEWVCA